MLALIRPPRFIRSTASPVIREQWRYGLVSYATMAMGRSAAPDLARALPAVLSSGSIVATKFGPGFRVVGQANGALRYLRWDSSSRLAFTNLDCSIALCYMPSFDTASNNALSNSGVNSQWRVMTNWLGNGTVTGSSQAGAVSIFLHFAGSYVTVGASGVFGAHYPRPLNIVFVRRGTAHELWIDGRLRSVVTATALDITGATPNGPATWHNQGGDQNASSANYNADGYYFNHAIFDRALTQDEAALLSFDIGAISSPWITNAWVDIGAMSETLTGVSAAGAVDNLTADVTSDASVTLSEVSAASAVGTLSADITDTETLIGLSAAANVNDLTVSVSSDAEVTLTGLSAAGAVNDLTVEIVGDALSVALTGVSADSAVGTLSVTSDTADSISLAGVSASSDVGTLDVVSTQVLSETLSGVSANAEVSDLTADVDAADALAPVSAQAEVGELTAEVSAEASVTLTGVEAAATVADLTTDLSLQLEVELTGVSAVGDVRDLIIPTDEPLIDEEIRDALKHLVRGNVHPLRRPQRTTQDEANAHLPEIVYTIVSDDWEQAETLCGVGLHVTRVQLDVYAQHYREARAYAYAVAKEMDAIGWRMNMQPFPDDDEKIYRWQLEYSCWRNEVPPSLPLTSTHRGK